MTVRTLPVTFPAGTYPVHIGAGLRHRIGDLLAETKVARRVIMVSDENVMPLYGQDVRRSLERAGFTPHVVTLPAGEEHKTLDVVRGLYDEFIAAHIDRQTPVLALGGGVIGDLVGFTAATILRGVPFVQMPTTLLAMVDASVGGKTGVDLPQGKNLVGAFKFPLMVVADTDTLTTLPREEVAAGLAETIKHGLIGDPGLLDELEQGSYDWPDLVARAVAVKIAVVQEDPFEKGRRAVLNLGHTFGHALEQISGYRLRHGFAVAMGMVAAAHLGVELGETHPSLTRRLVRLLRQVGLPTHWSDVPELGPPPAPQAVRAAMQTDKKRAAGQVRFIIPAEAGHVFMVARVPEEAIMGALEAILGTQA